MANPIGTCMDNFIKKNPTTLVLEFETFNRPVVYPDPLLPPPPLLNVTPPVSLSSSPATTNGSPPSSPILEQTRSRASFLSSSPTPFRKLEQGEARQMQAIMNYDPLTTLTPSDKKILWKYVLFVCIYNFNHIIAVSEISSDRKRRHSPSSCSLYLGTAQNKLQRLIASSMPGHPSFLSKPSNSSILSMRMNT